MIFYVRPDLPGADLVWGHSGWPGWLGLVLTLSAIGVLIGGSTAAATRSLEWPAWAIVPGLWVAASYIAVMAAGR